MSAPRRCWLRDKPGVQCLRRARNTKRIGDHVYAYCDELGHEPLTLQEHHDKLDAWVEEAAADLQLDPDVVWHDVAVNYLMLEVPVAGQRAELARTLGIPADVVGL